MSLGGKLRIEIIRGKAISFDETDTVSIIPQLTVIIGGDDRHKSQAVEGINPTWNFAHEVNVGTTIAEVKFEVHDVGRSPPVLLGRHAAVWDLTTTSASKGETVSLSLSMDAADTQARGTLTGKYTYKANKPEKAAPVDPCPDVILAAPPVLNGQTSLASESGVFLWLRLVKDAKWRATFGQSIVACKIGPMPKKPEPPVAAVEDVCRKRWKLTRTHAMMTRIRFLAELHVFGKSYDTDWTPESEKARKIFWKERSVMRDSFIVAQSPKLPSVLESLWWTMKTGSSLTPSVETRMSVDQSFQKEHYSCVVSALWMHMVPGITSEYARLAGEEDWNWDEDAKVNKDVKTFNRLLCSFASFWCETLTEMELVEYLKGLSTVMINCRKIHSDYLAAEAAKKASPAKKR